jgi:ferrous iron transport protein A
MSKTLKDLSVGDLGQVTGYGEGGRAYRKKLLSMGLTPGTELMVVRVAPMGDPVEIRVRGTSLSLRKGEAEALEVEKRS